MVTVRCPACLALYKVDPAKLGGGGGAPARKMKCARCGTVWLPMAEAAEEEKTAPEAQKPAEGVTETPQEDEPAKRAENSVQDTDKKEENLENPKDVAEAPPPEAPESPGLDEVLVRQGAYSRLKNNVNSIGWSRVGGLLIALVGLVLGVYLGWQHWGNTAAAGGRPAAIAGNSAAATGSNLGKVVPAPKGVVLRRVHSDIRNIKGGVLLTVRGLITNTTSQSVPLPPLVLQLLDANGKVADMWPVNSISGTIAAKTENAWTVSLTEPDLDRVRGWRVVFSEE